MSQILELFLETGVDSDCYILMKTEDRRHGYTANDLESGGGISDDRESEGDSEPYEASQQQITKWSHTDVWTEDKWTWVNSQRCGSKVAYVISLGDFIRRIKPANYQQLERLLGKNNCKQEFSTAKLSEIEAELATSKHPAFDFPTVRPVDLNHIFNRTGLKASEHTMVYWIRWKDATIPGSLQLRLY